MILIQLVQFPIKINECRELPDDQSRNCIWYLLSDQLLALRHASIAHLKSTFRHANYTSSCNLNLRTIKSSKNLDRVLCRLSASCVHRHFLNQQWDRAVDYTRITYSRERANWIFARVFSFETLLIDLARFRLWKKRSKIHKIYRWLSCICDTGYLFRTHVLPRAIKSKYWGNALKRKISWCLQEAERS